MIETFKKWFGKEEKKEIEEIKPAFDYTVIFAMKDGSYVEGLAINWESADEASSRIIELLEKREWFGTESPTGEELILRTSNIDRATVKPEPFRPTEQN